MEKEKQWHMFTFWSDAKIDEMSDAIHKVEGRIGDFYIDGTKVVNDKIVVTNSIKEI